MKVPFNQVSDAKEPLPRGAYPCRVVDAKEGVSSKGFPLWKLRLVVLEGEHAGRAIFDQLAFSPAALRRVKLVCASLGLDVSQPVDLTPDMLIGKTCHVEVFVDEYVDQEGECHRVNKVPFDGYLPAIPSEHAEDDPPF